MSRRILSLLLALVTVLTLPLPALAEEDGSPAPSPTAEATQAPEATGEPEATAEPEATDVPEATAVPEVTAVPETTDEPETADEPETTEEPETTDVPDITPEPETTDVPEATEEPDPNEGIAPISYSPDASVLANKNFSNLVLFAYFSDQEDNYFSVPSKAASIMDIYNGAHGRSFTSYMNTISAGNLRVANLFPQYDAGAGVIRAAKLTYSTSDAKNGIIDAGIIDQILDTLDMSGTGLDLYRDGMVDNVTVILQGDGSSAASTVTYHAHKSDYTGEKTIGGSRIGCCNFISTGRLETALAGVLAHEFLHTVGFSDLYTSDGTSPVGTWDIMAVSSYAPSWPLAYLRYRKGWVTLSTVTESTSLTFCPPGESGTQAYILKSPRNDSEVFVVEMRRKNRNYISGNDTLDSAISPWMEPNDAGLIVYRVNTTVENLSNYHGGTGIYVFRPSGEAENTAVQKAFLNTKSGRTTMGVPLDGDMSSGIPLAFSTGENSGIVIKDVAGDSDTMTCTVEFPSVTSFDTWDNTSFSSSPDANDNRRTVAMANYNGTQYLAVFQNSAVCMYRYTGSGWTQAGQSWSGQMPTWPTFRMTACGSKLYLAYCDSSYSIRLRSFDPASNTWAEIATISGTYNGFDLYAQDGQLYIAGVSLDASYNAQASLFRYDGSSLEELGVYNADNCGQSQAVSINGTLYTAARLIGNTVKVYRREAGGSFTELTGGSIRSSNFGMIDLNGRLTVVATNSNDVTVWTYDGSGWSSGKTNQLECFEPKLTAVQGNLYMLASPSSGSGYTYVYQYDPAADAWIREGETVDAISKDMTLTSDGNYLYISYVRNTNGDNTVCVKRKAIANPLQSISVTPPAKTSYDQGDVVSTDGMTVTANYKKGSRVLGSGEYAVIGYDSYTAGDRTATVSFGGMSATFAYHINAVPGWTPPPTATPTPTPKPTPAPTPKPTPRPQGRWAREGGKWYWYENGVMVRSAFVDGGRYYVGSDGVMVTGWKLIGGAWYWFNPTGTGSLPEGAMVTGWLKTGGKWYYLQPGTGRMLTGLISVGSHKYYMDGSGAMLTGWRLVSGSWYWFNPTSTSSLPEGAMATGWLKTGGKWYYLQPGTGKMLTGLISVGSHKYYMDGSGAMVTGWKLVSGSWYWFAPAGTGSLPEGAMATGWLWTGGKWYYLQPGTGRMLTGLILVDSHKYYMDGSGAMVTGWKLLDGSWYWFNPTGSSSLPEGAMASGWLWTGGKWYYLQSGTGKMLTGWLSWNGSTYYLQADGRMACGETLVIAGVSCSFDSSGARIK